MVRQSTIKHGHAGLLRGETAGAVVELEGAELAELAEHCEIAARSAAGFENPAIAGWGDSMRYDLAQDLASSNEPPMLVFVGGHAGVDVRVHCGSSVSVEESISVKPMASRTR